MDEQQDRARRRAAMPICSAFVDQLYAVFGPDQVQVLYAAEAGLTWGNSSALAVDAVIAEP